MTDYMYPRKWRVLVSSSASSRQVTDQSSNTRKVESAIDVSKLKCTFNIRKNYQRQNVGIVSIYNLSADLEAQLISEGDRVIIEAGYESMVMTGENKGSYGEPKLYGKIYDGSVIKFAKSKENNTDRVLTLVCQDADQPLNLGFISQSYTRGLTAREAVNRICSDSTIKLPVGNLSESLQTVPLPRGKVVFGAPKDYIDSIAKGNAAQVWTDGEIINVTKITDPNLDEAIVLTPESGLIGDPDQTPYGITFRCFLRPDLKFRGLVQLKSAETKDSSSADPNQTPPDPEGIYQINDIVYVGDTWGQDWYCQIEGISRYGKSALPMMMDSALSDPNRK